MEIYPWIGIPFAACQVEAARAIGGPGKLHEVYPQGIAGTLLVMHL